MWFHSIEFALFLPIVFIIYWFVLSKSLRLQNYFLLFASYFFYGFWDFRFLGLILLSTCVDYWVGLSLGNTKKASSRRQLLWLSIGINIGLLALFKYFNFFAESFAQAFFLLGVEFSLQRLNLILPVGISFYTFQTLSYTIDVYRKTLKPTRDFVSFAAFVSFFPQLVAGPIERATNLLPQFQKDRTFEYQKAADGLRQILWGLVKKVLIADNCAVHVDYIFSNSTEMSGSTLALGAILFAFQVYGDFSGYSDIAIGTARLFGFNLKQNFAYPFFAKNLVEFWRRWHISLITWFQDYIYIPLGGSRVSRTKHIRNIFAIFLISGLWHGANWTYIMWGGLNALFVLPAIFSRDKKQGVVVEAHQNKAIKFFKTLIQTSTTFLLFCFPLIIFCSSTVNQAFTIIPEIFSLSIFTKPSFNISLSDFLTLVSILVAFITLEWIGRKDAYGIETLGLKWHRSLRFTFYYFLGFILFWLGGEQQDFVYFQF